MIYVDTSRCTGCGLCLEACPVGALQLVEGVAWVNQDSCRACGACIEVCPQSAILSVTEPDAARPVRTDQRSLPVSRPDKSPVASVDVPGRAWPWLGAALAFVGREVVPRVVVSLLDAWDRRTGASTSPMNNSASAPFTKAATLEGYGWTGRKRRFRWRNHSR